MGIDGTKKLPSEGFDRPWPNEIVMTPEIRRAVEERWAELGIPVPRR